MKNKKFRSRESTFLLMAFVCLLLIIVISSIANAWLDTSKIFTKENLSNMIINAAITIFGVVSAIPAGIAETKLYADSQGNPGRYRTEKSEYDVIRAKIEPRRFMFHQWHYQEYLKENREKKVTYLLGRGVTQADDILSLDYEQILSLSEAQHFTVNGEDKYFMSLSPMQIEACIAVYSGKMGVHRLSDYYFLYIDGKASKSFYDQAYYEAKDESISMYSRVLYKVVAGFLLTCIFTGLAFEIIAAPDAAYIIKAIIVAAARVFAALSATAWGYLIGQEHVYKLCYYINGKKMFLQAFDADKDFVYRSAEDLAREEYDTRELMKDK